MVENFTTYIMTREVVANFQLQQKKWGSMPPNPKSSSSPPTLAAVAARHHHRFLYNIIVFKVVIFWNNYVISIILWIAVVRSLLLNAYYLSL